MDALHVLNLYKSAPSMARSILAESLRDFADGIEHGNWKLMELQSMDGGGTIDGDYSILYLKVKRPRS